MTSAVCPQPRHEAANPRAAARSVIPTGRAPISPGASLSAPNSPALAIKPDPYLRQRLAAMPAPDESGGLALVGEIVLKRLYEQSGTPRLQPRAPMSKQSESDPRSHDASSYAEQTRPLEVSMSSPATGRTFEQRSADIKERDVAKQVASALVVDFGHYRSTHKAIAKIAGASPETVKRWVAADSAPSLVFFLRLLPHSPSLRKLIAMEQDLDPGFSRELIHLMQKYVR